MDPFIKAFFEGKKVFSSDTKIKLRRELTEEGRERFIHDFNASVRLQVQENERRIRANPIRDRIRMRQGG